jgi:signal transduction histidine kinase
MKAVRYIVLTYTVIMIVALAMFIKVDKNIEYKDRDILYYNEQLHKVIRAYEAGVAEDVIESEYECEIVFSKNIEDPELICLYERGDFVLDLIVNGEYVGKVAWDDGFRTYDDIKHEYLKAALLLWLIVLGSGYLLLFIIYHNLILPIYEMNKYAEEIAKGNLDVSIPMRKHNFFGGFTEAFDIMREELKDAKKREIESEIARKELVASLSHDIKTPLAVIKATCEVLELKLKRSLSSNPVEGILNNVSEIISYYTSDRKERMSELEDGLTKISTISDKADTITSIMSDMMHANLEDLERIDVNPTEENSLLIMNFFENLHDYGKICMVNSIPPCLVYMDKLRMEQVIDNIVGNSYKYAGTDIVVKFDEAPDMEMADGSKGRFIRIRISDSGPGVSEDDLPLVAEKYYRGSNSAGKNGYGLGMYLCRCYMEKQHGGMDYYNDNGFTVELLLKKV